MNGLIERQVIVTWYTPEEKLPPEYHSVVTSISGKIGKTRFDHALTTAMWADDGCGWIIEGYADYENADITVHAWADIEPYGFKKETKERSDEE